ncbi:MAG: type II toxin-antitoxin system death-on-curing family toxin [Chlamydiota bacterium]
MIHYISLENALEMHDRLITDYGGLKGVLNLGLLQSALETPKASFNRRHLYRTIFDKAAAYLFHITQNHAFVDGNKRTAGMISITFLASNDVAFTIAEADYEELILKTAQGKATKKEIAKFFRNAHKEAVNISYKH